MGILTSAEFDKKKDEGVIHDPRRPNQVRPGSAELAAKGLDLQRRMIFPNAPAKGKSNAAFYLDGEEVQVSLVDREYVFPSKMSEAERDAFSKKLETVGFIDESTVVPAKPKALVKRYAHPDNTVDTPVALDKPLKFTFKRNGKRETVAVVLDRFGTVTTDDVRLQAKLVKDKWPEVTNPDGYEARFQEPEKEPEADGGEPVTAEDPDEVPDENPDSEPDNVPDNVPDSEESTEPEGETLEEPEE